MLDCTCITALDHHACTLGELKHCRIAYTTTYIVYRSLFFLLLAPSLSLLVPFPYVDANRHVHALLHMSGLVTKAACRIATAKAT